MQQQPNNAIQRRIIGLLVGLMALVCAGLIGWSIYNGLTFRITSVDPTMEQVSTQSPFIRIHFNKNLNPASLRVTDNGGILQSSQAQNKTVTLLFARALTAGKKYSVTLDTVRATDGKVISNQVYTFTAQDIPVNELSDDQQNYIVAHQDNIPYLQYTISYTGFSALTDQGITSGQVDDMKTALFNYSKQINKEFWTMSLDTSSVKVVFHDPTTREANASSVTFKVSLGGQYYTVRSEYADLDDNTYTRIYDPSGAQVFDNTANTN